MTFLTCIQHTIFAHVSSSHLTGRFSGQGSLGIGGGGGGGGGVGGGGGGGVGGVGGGGEGGSSAQSVTCACFVSHMLCHTMQTTTPP